MGIFSDIADVLAIPFSLYQNHQSLKAQRGENALNREFQAEQNNLDRQFQWRMNQQTMQSQQDFQRQLFDYQLQQQSPQNQVARLMAAGINPAALLGSSGGVTAAPNVSVPSAAPGATPGSHGVSPTSGLQVPNNSIAQMFSSIAQLQESVAIAKKSGVEANAIESKLPVEIERLQSEVKKTLTEANLNDALQANNRFDLLLKQTFGYSEKNLQLQKLMSESFKNFASGNLDKAKEDLTKVEKQLSQYEVDFKKETFDDAVAQVGILRNLYDAQIQTEKAKQANEYASAEEHKAGADLKEQQTATEAQNTRITEAQADLLESTFNQTVAARLIELRREGKNTEKLEKEIEVLRKQIDWYDLDKWWSKGESVAKALGVTFGAAIGLGKFKSLRGIKPIKGFQSGVR